MFLGDPSMRSSVKRTVAALLMIARMFYGEYPDNTVCISYDENQKSSASFSILIFT